jgi:hypothetical protein
MAISVSAALCVEHGVDHGQQALTVRGIKALKPQAQRLGREVTVTSYRQRNFGKRPQ